MFNILIPFCILATCPGKELKYKNFICPNTTSYKDAKPPQSFDCDEVIGIYLNILYPEDDEKNQKKRLREWLIDLGENKGNAVRLSNENLQDLPPYILRDFGRGFIRHYFSMHLKNSLAERLDLNHAICQAFDKSLFVESIFKMALDQLQDSEGRSRILKTSLEVSHEDIISAISSEKEKVLNDARGYFTSLTKEESSEEIYPLFHWDRRLSVLKKAIDKFTLQNPKAPFFIAFQEITPKALKDIKKIFENSDLQWISYNNMTGKETLPPYEEQVLGESQEYTSTIALSKDLKVEKIEIAELPTESDHRRKILGVRVKNVRNERVFNVFTTHTDYNIINNYYQKTAYKICSFVRSFLNDDFDSSQRFLVGGDFNSFTDQDGEDYIFQIQKELDGSRDFRESNFYAPYPIARSTFIGRNEDTFTAHMAIDGRIEPSALDHIFVGKNIDIIASSRDAIVYGSDGSLLDYYIDREQYLESLKNGITFSDHFANIIKFK